MKQKVTGITITGNTAIAPGTSTTLKAAVTPTNASNKNVTWSLDSAPAGVTVSSSGTVKIPSTVTSGTVTVRATANDGQGAYDTHKLRIQAKISALTLAARSSYSGKASGFIYKNGKLSSVNLFSLDIPNGGQDNFCGLKATISGYSVDYTWTSSNASVASVDSNGYVTAHKAGTAKITCTAMDSSKKSASVTVKVTNPVSYMAIKSSAQQMTNETPYIGIGKSVTNKVVFGDTYGTPGNKTVTWDYTVTQIDRNGTKTNRTSMFKNNNLVTVKNGTVKVSSDVRSYWGDISGEYQLTLYAYANDGTGASATQEFLLIPPATKVKMAVATKFYAARNDYGSVCFASDQWHAFSNKYNSGFVVTSSNPKVCSVGQLTYNDDLAVRPCEHGRSGGGLNYYDLHLYTGNTKGKATITIKATDGSNKSCSFTVTVN